MSISSQPAASSLLNILRGGILVLLLGLTGCASRPVVPDEQSQSYPELAPRAAPKDGSLFNAGTAQALFADRRASGPGDMLTVILSEKTLARKSATTTTSKANSVSLGAPNLFGRSPSPNPTNVELAGEREFEGSGDSAQSNQLEGRLTVFVTERLNNGALRITGEKRLRLNQGMEVLQISGIVRPDDIAPDNTVPSHRIAQAEISYAGRGAIADANSMGWLARFFNSAWWPF